MQSFQKCFARWCQKEHVPKQVHELAWIIFVQKVMIVCNQKINKSWYKTKVLYYFYIIFNHAIMLTQSTHLLSTHSRGGLFACANWIQFNVALIVVAVDISKEKGKSHGQDEQFWSEQKVHMYAWYILIWVLLLSANTYIELIDTWSKNNFTLKIWQHYFVM